jgi:hypothetical protein
MSHPRADMVRYARALLLRASATIDSRTVDAFVASELFAEAVSLCDESLLDRFRGFAGSHPATPADAGASGASAPTVTAFSFEDFSTMPVTPVLKSPARTNDSKAAPLQTGAELAPVARAPLPDVAFRLANARQGEVYAQRLVPQSGRIDDLSLLAVKFPLALDLKADLLAGLVAGTPATAGDFGIEVIYCFKSEGQARKRQATVTLLVNPDPKSLWKDLPSDRSDIFWKADAVCSAVVGPEFRMIAASKRGRSHAHVGGFRDDDYFIHHSEQSSWYTAIVADGAGSAKYSRRGAKLVCDEAGAYLIDALNGKIGATIAAAAAAYHAAKVAPSPAAVIDLAWQELRKALYTAVGHAAFHCVKAINDTVANCTDRRASYKDFSTTALISVTRRFPFGTLCAAYWVGDGAVGIYSKENGVKLLGAADSGEFSGQTRFLDACEVRADALLRRTRFELVDEFTALILMTDGVSDPKFDTEANLERPAAWDALWNDLDQAVSLHERAGGAEQRLLSWLDFWSQGSHDDRTIAIVY